MNDEFHILNGDALLHQFPKQIHGEKIVTKECLVDGDVEGGTLEELFSTRAKFLSDHYPETTAEDYFRKTVPEFEKMKNISEQATINLWFEDDLFCQVNLWFVLHLLNKKNKLGSIYLVRPKPGYEYSFGSMSEFELVIAFQNKIKIESAEFHQLSQLWKLYQEDNVKTMLAIAEDLPEQYSFLKPTIEAHSERLPYNEFPGRPSRTLLQIMEDLGTDDFAPVFREFCKRESIYGFGDLQVKRLLDQIKQQKL